MRFRILGPLEARSGDGSLLAVRAPKHRVLLTMLLMHANHPVPTDRMIEALWPDRPPRSVRGVLRTYVCAVRAQLACGPPTSGPPLRLTPGGYRLELPDDELDMLLFQQLIGEGERALAAADLPRAADRLHAALTLWRGPLAEDVSLNGPVLALAATLEEQRLAAQEAWFEVRLALGQHTGVVPELRALITANPLRERLSALLMTALYRSGRQADALAAYTQVRRALVDELGVEPGPALRQLHQEILTQSGPGRVFAAESGPVLASGPAVVPRQLPPPVRHFVGRTPEMVCLSDLASEAAAGAVVVAAIGGTAGVGKTAAAIYAAHHLSGQFPDGQLYLNLRGFDPVDAAVSPGEAVRALLDALGVSAQQVPATTEAQAGLYRSLMAGRRMLVLLDNARGSEQVRPLLPGTPGCLTLVTSRDQLRSLVADGAHAFPLSPLSTEEARQLLRAHLGEPRADADPVAVDQIIASCARLPLSLAVTAARAATNPAFPLSALAAELREAGTVLDVLDGGDVATGVRAVLSWSYRTLRPDAAALFRLLGLHTGPDIGVAAAASLAGVSVARVRPLLAELTRTQVLTEPAPHRYGFHDLLRHYAAELVRADEPEQRRRRAQHRLLDHYRLSARAAARMIQPHRDRPASIPAQPGVTPESFATADQALSWYATEHAVLVSAVRRAGAAGLDAHAWQLAWDLAEHLDRRGHWQDWLSTMDEGLAAAERLGDESGQAMALRGLAAAHTRLGQLDAAVRHLTRALAAYHRLGDTDGQARTYINLSRVYEQQSRFSEALGHAEQALTLFEAAGQPAGQARALNAMGWLQVRLGRYQQALCYCQRALALHRDLGDRYGLAVTWDSLGYAHHHRGDHSTAADCYQQALALHRESGDRYYEADTLVHLGDAYAGDGDSDKARMVWREAVRILDELRHPDVAAVREKLEQASTPAASIYYGQ